MWKWWRWIVIDLTLINSLNLLKQSFRSPLFKFGVISDIQYADSDDAWNFQQTKLRRYGNSLKIFEESIKSWNEAGADFSLILGDIIDIRTSLSQSQQSCLSTFLDIADGFKGKNYYCFGNHCLTCFPRKQLRLLMGAHETHLSYEDAIGDVRQSLSYFWNPSPDWCFISLDGYDLSIVSSSSQKDQEYAQHLIKQHNPNDLSFGSNKWYDNLPKDKWMWTPNNGGFSEGQLRWLDEVLRKSQEKHQKVVIFCHEPVYAPNNPVSVAWNNQDVLNILWKYDHIVMWLAGHDHDGQSHLDSYGIHHIVPPAPIEREVGDSAFGLFEVHEDRLYFKWNGSLPTDNNPHPWPSEIPLLSKTSRSKLIISR